MSRFGTPTLALWVLGCASPAKPVSEPPTPALVTSTPVSPNSEPRTSDLEPTKEGAPAPISKPEPEPIPEPEPNPSEVVYQTPLLDSQELRAQAREVCERSRESGRPILVELSADWCGDCRKLESAKAAAPLRDEMQRWEWFSINVGDGFQHPELMRAFRVDAIAKLVALRPQNCAVPLAFWRPIASRTLSGLSGDHTKLNQTLTTWLTEQRGR